MLERTAEGGVPPFSYANATDENPPQPLPKIAGPESPDAENSVTSTYQTKSARSPIESVNTSGVSGSPEVDSYLIMDKIMWTLLQHQEVGATLKAIINDQSIWKTKVPGALFELLPGWLLYEPFIILQKTVSYQAVLRSLTNARPLIASNLADDDETSGRKASEGNESSSRLEDCLRVPSGTPSGEYERKLRIEVFLIDQHPNVIIPSDIFETDSCENRVDDGGLPRLSAAKIFLLTSNAYWKLRAELCYLLEPSLESRLGSVSAAITSEEVTVLDEKVRLCLKQFKHSCIF